MSKQESQESRVKSQELQQQVADLTEALQRERADAINTRRRHDEQMMAVKDYAKAEVLKKLLTALDNLERSLNHVPAELAGNDYVKGVQSVAKQFDAAFTELGVQKIATVGEPFNPHIHEAMSMEDGEGDQEVVTEELQSGYKIGDTVLRPAMVRVGHK
jgi:molecular chaperone GrpE